MVNIKEWRKMDYELMSGVLSHNSISEKKNLSSSLLSSIFRVNDYLACNRLSSGELMTLAADKLTNLMTSLASALDRITLTEANLDIAIRKKDYWKSRALMFCG